MRPLCGNPLLAAHQAWSDAGRDPLVSEQLITSFSFAVPTEQALRVIASISTSGVVEIGAGLGYWAAVLSAQGVDVVAYDIAPPPSDDNTWFAGIDPWFKVQHGGVDAVERHADRALLIVWPTRNELWPAAALETYLTSGGQHVIYVGQHPGGRTGDDRFHGMLGELTRCSACAYDLAGIPCVCDVVVSWQREQVITLPHFEDQPDELRTYARLPGTRADHAVLSPSPLGRPRRPGQWRRRLRR